MPQDFSISRDTVSLSVDGTPRVFSLSTPQGRAVAKALRAKQWNAALNYAKDRLAAARDYVKSAGLDLDALPPVLKERALRMADQDKDPTGLVKFWVRLQGNPSKRAVDGLFTFLEHLGIPILADGTFLAYKGVGEDLYDKHSHTNLNKPGSVFKMDRNRVSDDPNTPCHEGLHVGAHAYASSFGQREVCCKVSPENVVCIPYDHNAQKMRVCEYEVVGFNLGQLMAEDEDLDGFDYESALREGDSTPPSRTVSEDKVKSFGRLSGKQLLEKTIDELRAYAKRLKIVGASKVAGGKAALIRKITRARQGSRG